MLAAFIIFAALFFLYDIYSMKYENRFKTSFGIYAAAMVTVVTLCVYRIVFLPEQWYISDILHF